MRGPRFATVGTGLGMATLLAYAYRSPGPPTPANSSQRPCWVFWLLPALRILMGVGDPNKVTRTAIADVLSNERPDLGAAFGNWLGARPVQWLGEALAAAARYRTGYPHRRDDGGSPARLPSAHQVNDALSRAQARAAVIADQIRSKHRT